MSEENIEEKFAHKFSALEKDLEEKIVKKLSALEKGLEEKFKHKFAALEKGLPDKFAQNFSALKKGIEDKFALKLSALEKGLEDKFTQNISIQNSSTKEKFAEMEKETNEIKKELLQNKAKYSDLQLQVNEHKKVAFNKVAVEPREQQKSENKSTFSSKGLQFECNKCDFTSTSKRDLRMHYISIHSKQNICEFCEKHFKTEDDLDDHINDEHECLFCETSFPSRSKLKEHRRKYMYGCVDCKKCFNSEYVNDLHQLELHPNSIWALENIPESTKMKFNHGVRYWQL